jgi:hypothetical protein
MSPVALMAGGGGQLGDSGARGKTKGGFYRHVEAVPPHRRGLQGLQHGRGRWRRASAPTANGERRFARR